MNLLISFFLVATFFSCGNTPKASKQTLPEKSETVHPHKTTIEESKISKTQDLGKNGVKTDSGLTIVKTEKKVLAKPKKLKEEKIELEPETKPVQTVNHDTWDNLLKKYVDNKGNVSYSSFKNDIDKLQSYLDYLAVNDPSSSWSKNEKLAYYINLYNAATVKLILDNYPTKSIKAIKNPWSKKWVQVGNEKLSLGNIEHKILRKMNEPRIHFAINCASYSCPKLVNTAFTASQMENQLEQATKDFINDTTRNKFTDGTARLSEIFKWYKGDFKEHGTLLEYIKNYAAKPINTDSKIVYLNYDWSLNESK